MPEIDFSHLLQQYGYLIVLLGTFLEGETILILGGFAAHRGYLSLPWVILIAFCGSLAGDQLWFFLGRRHGKAILKRNPFWQTRVRKVTDLFRRYHTPVIVAFRFFYGLRNLTPFVLGMTSVPAVRFFCLTRSARRCGLGSSEPVAICSAWPARRCSRT